MLFEVLALFTLIGVGMAAVGGMRGDKTWLLPASGIFILISSMLFISGTVQFHDGYAVNEDRQEINTTTGMNITVKRTEVKTFTDIDEDYASFDLSELLALLYLVAGLYTAYIGVWGKGRGERGAALRRRRR